MSESMREEFEVWAKNHNASLCEDRFDQPEDIRLDRQWGVYIWANAESAWLAWQASRAALCVELPPSLDMPDEDECGDYEEYEAMEAITCMSNTMRSKCRNAIHAAGVKTK